MMQSSIIVMCPVIVITNAPTYQLSYVATLDQVTEDMEEELAQECVIFLLDWYSMMMGSYLLMGCFLMHFLSLLFVRIKTCSRVFGNL